MARLHPHLRPLLDLAGLSQPGRRSGVSAPLAPSPARCRGVHRRPVRACLRHIQPPSRLPHPAQPCESPARPVDRPGRPVRPHVRTDLPGARSARTCGLARVRAQRGNRGGRLGSDRQGGERRHEPPVRSDAPRPPDRIRPRLACAGSSGRRPRTRLANRRAASRPGHVDPSLRRPATRHVAWSRMGGLGILLDQGVRIKGGGIAWAGCARVGGWARPPDESGARLETLRRVADRGLPPLER